LRGLHAVDAGTGEKQWTYDVGSLHGGPAVLGDTVYIAPFAGGVHALARKDGSKRWEATTGANALTSPAVDGKRAYVACHDGALYAFDLQSGDQQWKTSIGSDAGVYCNPVVTDDTVVIGDGKMHALDSKTGEQLWTHDAESGINTAVVGGTIYSGGFDSVVALA
jgi:outer membrane protein assembly factor BamB